MLWRKVVLALVLLCPTAVWAGDKLPPELEAEVKAGHLRRSEAWMIYDGQKRQEQLPKTKRVISPLPARIPTFEATVAPTTDHNGHISSKLDTRISELRCERGRFHGLIKNTGNRALQGIQVKVTAVDSLDGVLDTTVVYIAPRTLIPDQEEAFTGYLSSCGYSIELKTAVFWTSVESRPGDERDASSKF
jgi:hypothetical protein